MFKKRVDKWAFHGQDRVPSIFPLQALFNQQLNEMMKTTFSWMEDDHPEGCLYRERRPFELKI